MVKIKNLGHSCFLIKGKHYSVITDPYQNGMVPGLEFPYKVKANLVTVSHDHIDHNGKDQVKIIPSLHKIEYFTSQVPHDHSWGSKRGMCDAYCFTIDGLKIVHLGDLGTSECLKELSPFKHCDVLLGPINGFYTISAEEFKKVIDYIHPRLIIPMHYYNKEKRTGYEDNNQIEMFKMLYPYYYSIKGNELKVEKILDRYHVAIFE